VRAAAGVTMVTGAVAFGYARGAAQTPAFPGEQLRRDVSAYLKREADKGRSRASNAATCSLIVRTPA